MLAILMCISLMATMLTGCGSEGSQDSSTGSAESASGGQAASDSQTPPEEQTSGENVTINWLGYYTSEITVTPDSWAEQLLEETFHINLEPITDVSSANIDTYVSSGDILNATCYPSYLHNDFRYMYDQGLIREIPQEWLYEYYPTGMQLYTDFLGEEFFEKGDHLVDGRCLYIPFNTNAPTSTSVVVYRKDWMEKVGMSEPTTLEELHDLLYAFTYEDPDGNGKDDTYGIDIGTNWMGLWPVYGAFGFAQSQNSKGSYQLQEDGSVIYTSVQDAYKSALGVIKEWYDEGIIDPECITDKRDQVRTKWSNGTIGVMVDSQTWYYSNRGSSSIIGMVEDVFGEGTVEVMGPLSTAYGDGTVYASALYPNASANRALCFTANATDEQVITVLKMMEGLTTDHELATKIIYGEEGVDYTLGDSGQIQVTMSVEDQAARGLGDTFYGMSAPDQYMIELTQSERDKANIAKSGAWPTIYQGNNFASVFNEAYDTYTGEIQKVEEDFFYGVLKGDKDLEADWEQYLADMNKAGLDKVIAEYEEALK